MRFERTSLNAATVLASTRGLIQITSVVGEMVVADLSDENLKLAALTRARVTACIIASAFKPEYPQMTPEPEG